jgi:predicted transcriptional regulator
MNTTNNYIMPRAEEYLSQRQVAELLNVTPRTVQTYRAKGLLKALRPSDKFLDSGAAMSICF